jgi:transposase
MHIASIGIDIGKTTFHLVALNEHGSIVVRKKFSRSALLTYTANLSSSLIGDRHGKMWWCILAGPGPA